MSTYNIPAPSDEDAPTVFQRHELIKPGDYDLEIIYATDRDSDGARLTTSAGDPRIKMKVMTDDNKSFFHFLYLSEKAFPMVWEFLQACGIRPDGGEFTLDPKELEGKRFRATVYVQGEWNRLRRPTPVPIPDQTTPDTETMPTKPIAPLTDDDVPF